MKKISVLKIEKESTLLQAESDPFNEFELIDFSDETVLIINFDPNDQLNIQSMKDRSAISPMRYLTGLLELSRFQELFDIVIIHRIDMGCLIRSNTKKDIGAVLKQVFDRASKGKTLIVTSCTSMHSVYSRMHKTFHSKNN